MFLRRCNWVCALCICAQGVHTLQEWRNSFFARRVRRVYGYRENMSQKNLRRNISWSQEADALAEALAKDRGMNVSEFVRTLLMKEVQTPQIERKADESLSAIVRAHVRQALEESGQADLEAAAKLKSTNSKAGKEVRHPAKSTQGQGH